MSISIYALLEIERQAHDHERNHEHTQQGANEPSETQADGKHKLTGSQAKKNQAKHENVAKE